MGEDLKGDERMTVVGTALTNLDGMRMWDEEEDKDCFEMAIDNPPELRPRPRKSKIWSPRGQYSCAR